MRELVKGAYLRATASDPGAGWRREKDERPETGRREDKRNRRSAERVDVNQCFSRGAEVAGPGLSYQHSTWMRAGMSTPRPARQGPGCPCSAAKEVSWKRAISCHRFAIRDLGGPTCRPAQLRRSHVHLASPRLFFPLWLGNFTVFDSSRP